MYFAKISDEKALLEKLQELIYSYYRTIEETGFAGLWKLVYKTYQSGQSNKGQLQRLENEEHQTSLLKLRINDFGNIITHLHMLITKDPPSIDALPISSNSNALSEALPAKRILEFYQNKKFLDKTIRDVKLYELLMGEGYLVVDWDKEAGLTVAKEELEDTKKSKGKTPRYMRQGDLIFKAKSPFNVIRDVYQEPQGMKWHIVRDIVNFELLAEEYRLDEDDCQQLNTMYTGINYESNYNYNQHYANKIDIYTLYHSPIAEYPEGRKVTFIKDKILEDSTLRGAEVIRSAHQNIENTSLGNTVAFDLIEIETAKNNIVSAIINNNARFGLHAIVSAKGSKVEVQKLLNGVTLIEYDPASPEDVPKTLQLNSGNQELYAALNELIKALQRNSGINDVIRGQAGANQSGQALALLSSMAIQLAFGYQQSFRETYKRSGIALLAVLKKNLSGSRQIRIIGKDGIFSREIQKNTLADEYDVIVELVSPLKTTVQARSQVADRLFDAGSLTPNQYVDFLNTGRLESIYDERTTLIQAMRKEKEALLSTKAGSHIIVESLQDHPAFIKNAMMLLQDADVVKNNIITKKIQNLIERRRMAWRADSLYKADLLLSFGITLHPEAAGKAKQGTSLKAAQKKQRPAPKQSNQPAKPPAQQSYQDIPLPDAPQTHLP